MTFCGNSAITSPLRTAGRRVVLVAVLAVLCGDSRSARATIVRFQTNVGNIDVRLYDEATPLSVANLLNYITLNRYDATFFHRVPQMKSQQGQNLGTSDFVIQGGGFLLNNSIFAATPIQTNAPVQNEPGISNLRGTLSYAKGMDPNSATSQWFFNISDNTFLDQPANGSFTAFGRVINGTMSVVDYINNLPAVNASAAENQPGEDYDEVPVTNLQQVLNQNDITNAEAVMLLDVQIRNLPLGDYNFNGGVTKLDLAVWESTFGSQLAAEADGNGNARVDGADFLIWQRTFNPNAVVPIAPVPEPAAAALAALAACGLAVRGLLARTRREHADRPRR